MHMFLVFNYYNIKNIFVVSINWTSIKIAITILKTLFKHLPQYNNYYCSYLLLLFVIYDHS